MSEEKVGKSSTVNTKKTVSKKTVSLIFRENRKFDLHIGRELMTFGPRERKEVPESWIKHPDFSNVAKYFVVRGI